MGLLEPGTYKIISNYDNDCRRAIKDLGGETVGWHIDDDSTDQKWYIQHSGKGYKLRNCQSGRYLTVQETSRGVEPICGTQPTRWEITQRPRGGSVLIRIAPQGEQSYFLALSTSYNYCVVILEPKAAYSACSGGSMFTNRDWTLQHLSDDAGEEKELPVAQQANAKDQQATRNKTPDAVNRKLLEKDALIAEKDRQLGEITNRLVTRDQELAEGVKRLAAQHQELAQIRLELVEARSCLVEAEDALGRAEEKLTSRETQLLRIQEQLNVGEPEDRLARQKEIDEIRTRMQAFEQFMLSQTANQGNKRDNNAV